MINRQISVVSTMVTLILVFEYSQEITELETINIISSIIVLGAAMGVGTPQRKLIEGEVQQFPRHMHWYGFI